jgi:hypothetical protein
MSEHWIRLRGGWRADRDAAAGPPGWLALPLAQPPWPDPPATLSRHFQAPPIDPVRERVTLVIDATPGLAAVRLNGRDLGPPDAMGTLRVDLPADLPTRNLLELEPARDPPPGHAGAWGRVALVIRPIGAGAGELGDPGEGSL